jgi:formamidopyrimidine-DNA glycosylase
MPELPEVEITARRLGEALAGVQIERAAAPGINALKTFDPPLAALEGERVEGVRRIGKHLVVDVSGGLHLLCHLMSAGRLQLFDKRAGPRDRTSRLLLGLPGERELRLREFGTRQQAWVKLLRGEEAVREDPAVATLGPEAWPDPPEDLAGLLKTEGPRPLHAVLRDQRVIAGIGRSWVDEVLWHASSRRSSAARWLRPRRPTDRLRAAILAKLGGALEHYAQRRQRCRSPTSSRFRSRSTVTRASLAPAADRRSRPSTTRRTSWLLPHRPRPAGKVLKDRASPAAC